MEEKKPVRQQFREAAAETIAYLEHFLLQQFKTVTGSEVEAFYGSWTGSAIDPPRAGFEVTMVFTEQSTWVPTQDDLDIYVEVAFQTPSVNELISRLQELKQSNPFSNVTSVTYSSIHFANLARVKPQPFHGHENLLLGKETDYGQPSRDGTGELSDEGSNPANEIINHGAPKSKSNAPLLALLIVSAISLSAVSLAIIMMSRARSAVRYSSAGRHFLNDEQEVFISQQENLMSFRNEDNSSSSPTSLYSYRSYHRSDPV